MSDVVAADHDGAASSPPGVEAPEERKRWRFGFGALTALTAAVALLSAVVALLFDLIPALKPDPRDRIGAEMSIFDAEPSVTYGDWLRRTNQRRRITQLRRAGDAAGLRLEGTAVWVNIAIEGFKRRSASLRWSLYKARSRTRLSSPQFRDQHATDVRLDAPSDRSVWQLFVPNPELPGTFFVRVELRDVNEVILAVADSRRFKF